MSAFLLYLQQGQASDEQKEKWLPLARDFKIIGAYAQTELGHGKLWKFKRTTNFYTNVKAENRY